MCSAAGWRLHWPRRRRRGRAGHAVSFGKLRRESAIVFFVFVAARVEGHRSRFRIVVVSAG